MNIPPPIYEPPLLDQPKKSSTALIVAIVAAVLLCLVGVPIGTYYALKDPFDRMVQTLDEYDDYSTWDPDPIDSDEAVVTALESYRYVAKRESRYETPHRFEGSDNEIFAVAQNLENASPVNKIDNHSTLYQAMDEHTNCFSQCRCGFVESALALEWATSLVESMPSLFAETKVSQSKTLELAKPGVVDDWKAKAELRSLDELEIKFQEYMIYYHALNLELYKSHYGASIYGPAMEQYQEDLGEAVAKNLVKESTDGHVLLEGKRVVDYSYDQQWQAYLNVTFRLMALEHLIFGDFEYTYPMSYLTH